MKTNGVPKVEYSGKEPASTRANYRKKDRIVDQNFAVDPMGYWNPENIGKIVQVPTDDGHITMKGVNQPLIGMDEYGNTQYQIPGQEYHYPGKFITEYPVRYNVNPVAAFGGQHTKTHTHMSKGGWLDEMQEGGSKNPEWYNGQLSSGMKYPLQPNDKRRIPQSGMVVDKRTNQAYYFGDKGETGSFPVLTGKNVEGNRNDYSLTDLKGNSSFRNTPKGYYTVNKQSTYITPEMSQHYAGRMRDVEPISAYGVPAPKSKDLAFHQTYMDPFNPAVYKNRDSLYAGKDTDRNASYGCVNCEKASYDAFNKAIPKTDTMMVLDSKNYADRLLLEQAKKRMKTKPLMQEGGGIDFEGFRRKTTNSFPTSQIEAEAKIKKGLINIKRRVDKNGDDQGENAFEVFDPTGISSWNDVYNEYKRTGLSSQTALEAIGAIPLAGKLAKVLKNAPKVFKGLQGYEKINQNRHMIGNLLNNAAKAGRVSDGYQYLDSDYDEYRRGGQKGLKKFTSKNIATSVNDIMLRNETLFGPRGKKRYKPGLNFKEGGWLDNIV